MDYFATIPLNTVHTRMRYEQNLSRTNWNSTFLFHTACGLIGETASPFFPLRQEERWQIRCPW